MVWSDRGSVHGLLWGSMDLVSGRSPVFHVKVERPEKLQVRRGLDLKSRIVGTLLPEHLEVTQYLSSF
jgi:hypothetical protein